MSKKEREIAWVIVATNSLKEAKVIGRAVLRRRFCACYSVIPRLWSEYYWPPKTDSLENSRGPLLVLETVANRYDKISRAVKLLHSDEVPMIGIWEIENVSPQFYKWMLGEINYEE